MWDLQHSCVLRCTAKTWVAGTIQPLECADRACPLQHIKGVLNKSPATVPAFPSHWPRRACGQRQARTKYYSMYPIPPFEDRGALNCTIQILTFTPLLRIVLLLATKQIHQSVLSSRAVQKSRVWLRELQQQLLDKCFPYPLLLVNNVSSYQ